MHCDPIHTLLIMHDQYKKVTVTGVDYGVFMF